jgi:hypothetical protein
MGYTVDDLRLGVFVETHHHPAFGYYGRSDNGENSDGDHILKAQLIGKDRGNVIGNMWPLDKVEDRHGETS